MFLAHLRFQPEQSSGVDVSQLRVLAAQQVDELGSTRIDGTSRVLVGRNDQLGQSPNGLVLVGFEQLGLVSSGLFFLFPSRPMDVLPPGQFKGSDPGGRQGQGDPLQHLAPGQRAPDLRFRGFPRAFPFLISSARKSEALQARALMVKVGFLSGLLTKEPPSQTSRFFTS